MLPGAFVALALFACGRPVAEVAVYIIDRSFVTCLRGGHGVNVRRRRGIVCVLVVSDPGGQLTNALLEFVDGVLGCELVDASPFKVRVVALVGGRMTVVARDDPEVCEPVQVLPGCLRITVDVLCNRARRCWLAGLEDSPVDALLNVVAAKRVLKGAGRMSPEDSALDISGLA